MGLARSTDPHNLGIVSAYLLMAALTAACAGHIVASDLNFYKCRRQNQNQRILSSSFHGSVLSFASNVPGGYSFFKEGRECRVTAESSEAAPESLKEVAAPNVNEEGARGVSGNSVPIELSKFL